MQSMHHVHILGSKSFTKAYVSQIWTKSWSMSFFSRDFQKYSKIYDNSSLLAVVKCVCVKEMETEFQCGY